MPSLKKQVLQQVKEAQASKHRLDSHAQQLKQTVVDIAKSPSAFLGYFSVGAMTGWLATKPVNKTYKVNVMNDADLADASRTSTPSEPIFNQLSHQLISAGSALAIAELSRQLETCMHKEQQSSGTE
ncbi:hypothetical protein [Arenicella xantha]|uniref:Uncharacterized protein n=1 Tax=Arenicella xantha TaxID=644221 RepID=A0A395JMB4_9GAMM|nr:hypothetical protein [Arenicella xantha]RBP52784.1 hypothetical protein DFR28_101168 [Arenicella xantha]